MDRVAPLARRTPLSIGVLVTHQRRSLAGFGRRSRLDPVKFQAARPALVDPLYVEELVTAAPSAAALHSGLRDQGYEVAVEHGHLVISHVPYVTPEGMVAYGKLISVLSLAGDVTVRPGDHVVYFDGETPCDRYGRPLNKIINNSQVFALVPGVTARCAVPAPSSLGWLRGLLRRITQR
jgi:hypothetical protein